MELQRECDTAPGQSDGRSGAESLSQAFRPPQRPILTFTTSLKKSAQLLKTIPMVIKCTVW